MAERRMFAKTIIDSDAFLDMPATSQLLYFHLSMRADDEGFVNKPKSIMRTVGCKDDDMSVLIAKGFIIPFESGVVVIKHWYIHNWIRGDRKHDTKYLEEKSNLSIKENGSYTMSDKCLPDVNQVSDNCHTEVSLGKVSLGKDRIESADKPRRFIKPTVQEIADYCTERGNRVNAQRFFDFYESKGWKVGSTPMKNWKACVRTWEQRDKENKKPTGIHSDEDYMTSTSGYAILK